jgi:integrase
MRDKPRAHGPYRHGRKWRVHFVTGSGADRTTHYETFDSRAAAAACVDGARDEAQGITVSAAIKAYLDVKRAQGRAPLTLVAYEGRLNTLLASYLKRPVRSVQNRGAELYMAVLEGRGADGHQNLLTAGRLWGKWCVRQRWLRANPFAEVEPIGQRMHGADKVRLTVDESRVLEAWCLAHPTDQRAILTLGYLYLGTRNTELARERCVRDLDDGGRLLVIGKTKSAAGRRTLRIPDALAEMLRRHVTGRATDAPIFRDANGNRMGPSTARKHVRKVCELAGVTVVPPQGLRRTQASLATEAGETSLAVARHLGHASTGVTQQSYIERDAAAQAQGERAFRVIRGGKAR